MSEKILEKVRKLLEHSESALRIGSVDEGTAFAEQAQKLLDKYNLSRSDVEIHAAANEPIQIQPVPTNEVPAPAWQEILCQGIARVNGCYQVYAAQSGGICIVGRRADREITLNFFKYFTLVGERLKEEFVQSYKNTVEYYVYGHDKLGNAVDSYMTGYAIAIGRKLGSVYQTDLKDMENSQALVYLERREQDAQDWLKQRVPVVMDDTPIDPLDESYLSLGMDAGEKTAVTDKILG